MSAVAAPQDLVERSHFCNDGVQNASGVPHLRCALSGAQVTRVPLDQRFTQRFGQPYAVTHRADIHAVFLKACQGDNLITLETQSNPKTPGTIVLQGTLAGV